jgi:hypothetical protein
MQPRDSSVIASFIEPLTKVDFKWLQSGKLFELSSGANVIKLFVRDLWIFLLS